MIVLKKDNHIDETKLDRNESIIFIDMLRCELKRHEYCMYKAKDNVWYTFPRHNPIVTTFWHCQMENHKKDIEMIQKCINYLLDKWGLL